MEKADHRHRRLLRPRCYRPRHRAAQQRDELPPSHAGHGEIPPSRTTAASACHQGSWQVHGAGLNCSESRRPGEAHRSPAGGPACGRASARQVLFALAPAAAAVSVRRAQGGQAKGSLYAPKKASAPRTPFTAADVRDADVCGSTSAPWSLIARMRRCRGRRHFRAVHGDQIGHRGDRPDQANRNHDRDSNPCAHLHSLRRVELAKRVRTSFATPM
jgi:hypothetical protein